MRARPGVMRVLMIAVGAFAICAASGCGGRDGRKMEYYSNAHSLYQRGEYAKARLEVKKALQVDDGFAPAHQLLGLLELKNGNLQGAYAAFVQSAEIDPANRQSQIELGKLLLVQGATGRAREKASLVLEAHPRDADALLLQGAVLLGSGDPARAVAALTEVVGRGSGRAEAYLLLALAHHRVGDEAAAERSLREGIASGQCCPALHRALADLYARQGKLSAAAAEIREMIRLEPANHGYRIALADLLWRTGKVSEARAQLEALLDRHPADEEVISAVARFHASHEEDREAEKLLMQRVSVLRKSLRLRLELADLYVRTGKPHKALLLLEESLALDRDMARPEVVAVKNALAALHLEFGELAKARRLTNEVLRKIPAEHDANLTRGRLGLLLGRDSSAVAAFRTAVTERPNEVRGYLLLAEAYMLKEEMGLAFQALHEAQKLEPSSVAVRVALSRYQVRRHDLPAARKELQKGLAASPTDPELLAALGDVRLAAGDRGGAEKAFRAVSLSPGGTVTGALRLGDLYASIGMPDRAARVLEEALDASPASAELLERLVLHYLEEGYFKRAAAICRRRIAGQGDEPVTYLLLARVAGAQGAFEKAETFLNQAELHGAPGLQVSLLRAQLRASSGDQRAARLILEEVLAAEPDHLLALNDYACLLADTAQGGRDLRRALKLAKRVQARRPDDPLFKDTLGWVLYLNGDYQRAAQLLQQAAAKLPRSPVVQYHAGVVLYRTGMMSPARSYLRAAAKSKAPFSGKREALLLLEGIEP